MEVTPAAKTEAARYVREHLERFEPGGNWEPKAGETGLVFGPDTLTEIGDGVDDLARQAVLLGTRVYFLTPYRATRFNIGGEPDSHDVPPLHISWDNEFDTFLAPLLPYVRAGAIDVLPKWEVGGNWGYLPYRTTYHNVLMVSLTKDEFVKHLGGSQPAAEALRVVLPYLPNVAPEDLVQVRLDKADAMSELQSSIAALKRPDSASDAATMADRMRAVEESVRRMESALSAAARRDRRMSTVGAVGQFVVLLAPTAAGIPVGPVIEAGLGLLGATKAITVTKALRDGPQAPVTQHPWYVPWELQGRGSQSGLLGRLWSNLVRG